MFDLRKGNEEETGISLMAIEDVGPAGFDDEVALFCPPE